MTAEEQLKELYNIYTKEINAVVRCDFNSGIYLATV